MAPAGLNRRSTTTAPRPLPRAIGRAAFSYAYGYRAWRFTQALGRLS
jgi:hypothetical protein